MKIHIFNKLNLQDDSLTGVVSSVDVATKTNLEDLVKVGEGLLKKPVSRVNLDTGLNEPCCDETNEEALKRYLAYNSLNLIILHFLSAFKLFFLQMVYIF